MPDRVRIVIRHVIALLLSLAVFHLTLVDSALASCTSHGASEMSGMRSGATSATSHHMTHAALRDDVAPASNRAAPIHPACCDAGAPCGLLAIASHSTNERVPVAPRASRHAEPGALRLSVILTPEPPPPKA